MLRVACDLFLSDTYCHFSTRNRLRGVRALWSRNRVVSVDTCHRVTGRSRVKAKGARHGVG